MKNDQCLDDMYRLTIVYSSKKVVAKSTALTEDQRSYEINNFGAIQHSMGQSYDLCIHLCISLLRF